MVGGFDMFKFEDLIGKTTTPASRITSAIVSIITLVLIYFKVIPNQLIIGAFLFLGFHLINHIYAGISDLKVHVCHKCGKILTPNISYKHKCTKDKEFE